MKFFTSLFSTALLILSLIITPTKSIAQDQNSTINIPSPSNCKASADPLTITQSDGTTITIVGKGNMNNHWAETTDGFSIAKNTAGIYEYAIKQNGALVAGGTKANNPNARNATEQTFLTGIQPSLKPDLNSLKSSILNQVNHQLQNKTFPTTGNIRVLALLIDYPDLSNTYTKANFDSMLVGANYRSGDGSFKTFYETSSDGLLTITVDVYGWYRADSVYAYYGRVNGSGRAADLVREAVDAAELAGVDFSLYDNDSDNDVDGILAVHAGPGAESGNQTQFIWSHRWVLNGGTSGQVTYDGVTINDYMINPETRGSIAVPRMVGIGVFVHEFGHNLGLPDLYDTDNSNGDSEGIGEWGLMGSAGWLGGEHQPGDFCAWSKVENAWVTPIQLTIGNTGVYNSNAFNSSQYQVYQINTNLANEYFLLENRQKSGLDIALRGDGLAIWHINTTKTNTSGNSVNADETLKGVDLEEADGNDDLDNEVNRGDGGDLFPGTSLNSTFDNSSNPNSNTYALTNTNFELRNISQNSGVISFDLGLAPGPPCAASTTLTTTTGSFDDGSGAGLDYVNNQTCAWLIQPTAATTVTLSFSAFDTQMGIDTLTVYDGTNKSAPLIGKFSGNVVPANVSSTSGSMYVEFKTDATISGPGFDASYTSMVPGGPTCSGTTTLTTAMGNFSDGSGASNYSNNLNCSWLIQPPGASSITFGLTTLNTEISNDRIIIYDGINNSAPQLGSYSGTNNLNTLTSSGGSIFVEFITNGTVTNPGWDAFYSSSTTGPGCTGATTLTANTGSFSDGSMANNYDNNQFCSWLIQPTAGTITLSFSAFDTEPTFDRVIVHDGVDNTAPQIGNFSGTSIPANLTSTSNALYVEFRTNGTTTAAGWDASYITNVSTTTCTGLTTLTGATGNIDDGSGTANYSDNLNCTWLIQPTGGTGVTLTFSAFDTELNNDILYIYNGTNNAAPLIATLSGNTLPTPVSASSGSMFLGFATNGSINDAGWAATYAVTNPLTCSGTTTFTTPSGSFDDGSATANYDNNLSCSWLIQPPGSPASITLNMNSMNLADFGDRVRVYDGTSTAGTLIGNYFFNNTGSPAIAYSGSMFVEFITNGSNNANGWDATYSSSSSYCSPVTTYTNNFGNFTDGSPFGQNYLDNTDCSWLIQPTATNVAINLSFFQFNTEATNDSVTVYDGPTTSDPILATISGNSPTIPSILSTGGDMLVTFKTNGSTVATGWRANYTTQVIPACTGTTTLTGATGTFDDGTAATTNYAPNLNCSWLIQPAGASKVVLTFNRFNTEINFDEVTVYDGANNSATVIGSFSGTTLPAAITSSGNSLFVEFSTDGFQNFTGWEATYNSTTVQCFTNLQILSYNGNLDDGSGTSNYQDNLACSWVISPPAATSITATFNSFDLSDPGDTLYLYDGIDNTASLLAKYTGTTLPAAVSSTAGDLFIEFITDGSTNDAGWDLSYTSATPFTCAGQTNLTAAMGSFSDGSGTSNYDNNLTCSWLIQPTGNPAVITLSMTSMNLANFGDRVRVYDGINNSGNLIGNYFFNNLGNPIDAFSGSMYVEFVTDNNNTAQGWDATYNTSSSYCQASTNYTANFGFIDDGSPVGTNYLDNTSCQWLIQPTTPNIAVRLNFNRFDTENINDTVVVYDGTTTADPVLGKYSGNTVPSAITSSAGDMLVTFNSNGSVNAGGWAATYQTSPIPSCAGLTNLTAANGTFDDGSAAAAQYVQNSNCSWLISPPGALNVDLTFNRFNTQATFDILTVYDGVDNTAPVLGTYSGTTTPSMVNSSGGSLYLEFITNQFNNGTGWEVSYTSSNVILLDAPDDTVYINAGAGSTASFTLNSNIAWTTSDNGAWLIPTPINGSGNASINLLAIQANIGPERSAEVFINATSSTEKDTVVVIQRTSGRFMDANPDTLFFAANAAPSQNITLNSNVTWSLNPNASWIAVSPAGGSNNGSSSVSVQNNTSNQIRTDIVVVSGNLGVTNDTVVIVQDSAPSLPPSLSVNPMNITLAQAMGSSDMFTVNSNVNWQTQSGAPWLAVTNPAITSDTNTVQIMATSPNTALFPRAGFVAVQDVNSTLFDTVFVFQSGTLPILSGAPDTVLLASPTASTGKIFIGSNGNWIAVGGAPWFSLNKINGSGVDTLELTTNSANTTSNIRYSYVALADPANNLVDTVVVAQDSMVTTGLATTPDTIKINAIGGSSNTFSVSTALGWNAFANAPWLSLNPSTGTGSGTVTAMATANTSTSDRMTFVEISTTGGSIIIDTVWVIQFGVQTNLDINPSSIALNFSNGSNDVVNLTSNTSWTITNPASWLMVSPSSGSNDATITITATSDNLTGSDRTASLTVDGAGAVSKTIGVTQIDGSTPSFDVSTDTVFVANPQGSTGTFSVISNVNSWSISENTSWLLVNPTSGSGTDLITVLVATRNVLGVPRYTQLTASSNGFSDKIIVVAQEESTPIFQVAPDSLMLGADSASFASFNVSSNITSWSISENASWLEIDPFVGAFTQQVTAKAIEKNTTNAQRSEIVTVSAPPLVPQSIKITQDTVTAIGISDNLFENSFQIYPNPSSGNLTIKIGRDFVGSFIEAKLFNLLGEEISVSIDFSNSNMAIVNLSDHANGIYFLTCRYKGNVFSRKISILK